MPFTRQDQRLHAFHPMRLGSLLSLLLLLLGCDDLHPPEEEPPSRLRSLRQPRWEIQPGDTDASGVVNEVATRAATPSPTPSAAPTYKGVTQTLLEAFQRTELREARLRALDSAANAFSEADVAHAYQAIQSGRQLDATVGIALLSRYYERPNASGATRGGTDSGGDTTPEPRWDRLEEAYRAMFQAVPALRLSPEHLTEHAVSLAMLGRFNDALAEARAADELFRALPVGDDTRPHLSRLAQAQAWSYEGLAREALKNGVPDLQSRSLEQLAVVSWEKYLATSRAIRNPDAGMQEEMRKAEEHLQNLKRSLDLTSDSTTGGTP